MGVSSERITLDRPLMREIKGIIEAWLKHRVRSLYDVHARGYLVLGVLGWRAQGEADEWIARSIVAAIVVLVLSATLYEAWSRALLSRDAARS